MSRFFERERACQLPPSGCIASKEPGRVSGVDRRRHAVLSLSLPSVPCVSSYFSFSSALSSPIRLSSHLSLSLLPPTPDSLSVASSSPHRHPLPLQQRQFSEALSSWWPYLFHHWSCALCSCKAETFHDSPASYSREERGHQPSGCQMPEAGPWTAFDGWV